MTEYESRRNPTAARSNATTAKAPEVLRDALRKDDGPGPPRGLNCIDGLLRIERDHRGREPQKYGPGRAVGADQHEQLIPLRLLPTGM